jgi:elongation factor Ts
MADANLIALIKELREKTGAGMMDCKNALAENGNDIDKSVEYLRKKGMVKLANRASRTASEGLTNVYVCEKCGKAVILEINCETDFVSASDQFKKLLADVTGLLLEKQPKNLDEAKSLTAQLFLDVGMAVREKLELRRFALVEKKAEQGYGTYIHMGGKISVLVILSKENAELAKPLAMHIAANNPLYVAVKDIPASDKEAALKVAQDEVAADPKIAGKPDAVKAKIAEAKVDKRLEEKCLTLQPYLLDETKTVGDVLKDAGLEVVSFVRYQVGEGIAKNPDEAK